MAEKRKLRKNSGKDKRKSNESPKSPKRRKSTDSNNDSPKKKKRRSTPSSDSAPPKKKRKLNESTESSNDSTTTKRERKVFKIDAKLEEEFPPPLWKAAVHFGTTLRQVRQFEAYKVFLQRIKTIIPKELKPGKNKPRVKPLDEECPRTKPVCVITDVPFCTPRGKQQLEIYKTCLAFRSQNKVNKGEEPDAHVAKWKNVDRWLTLDEPGKLSHFFLKLKRPIQVGKHSSQCLHFQFGYGEELELKLDRKIGKVKPSTRDIAAETLGRVVETLSKTPLLSSRQAPFQSYKLKEPFVRCSFGSNMVSCYFLKIGIVLIPKPLKILEFKDISDVETGASGGRYINLTITTKEQKIIDLGMIPKDNQNLIEAYFRRFNVEGVPDPEPKKSKEENEMDWDTYQSDEDDEFDFQDALSKTDVTNDFVDGKLDLGNVASREWKQMRDVKESGALDGEEEEYDEEADSDFDFDDEVKKTDLKKDFVDKERSYDKMIEDKDFKKLIDRSGSGIEDEGGEFDADDLDFMKELGKNGSDSSEEESDPNEDPRAKRKRLRVKMMAARDSDEDDDDEENDSYEEEEEPEELYNVDKILGTKGKGKKMRVHVLWEAGDKTWEPIANVQETEAWELYLKTQEKDEEGDSEATEPED